MTVSKVSQSRNGHNWHTTLRCIKALLAMELLAFLAGAMSPRGDSVLALSGAVPPHPGIVVDSSNGLNIQSHSILLGLI